MPEQNSTSMEAFQVAPSANGDQYFHIPNSEAQSFEIDSLTADSLSPKTESADIFPERLLTPSEAYDLSRTIVAFRQFEDDSQIILDEVA